MTAIADHVRRHWDDLPLRVKGMAVIAIPLVPLLLSASLFVITARRQREAQDWVVHTLEVKEEIATTLSLLVDAEMGVRGILLTRQPDRLMVVQRATEPLQRHYDRLTALLADNPVQLQHMGRVVELTAKRPLRALVEHAQLAPVDAPVPIALLDQSHATMEELRQEFARMQEIEDQLLVERAVLARRLQDRLGRVAAGGAGLGVVGGLLATTVFAAGIRRRIDQVRVNAGHLARGEPLHPMPPADDEVGHLSQRLAEAETLLNRRVGELEEARQKLDRFFVLSLDMLCIAGVDGHFKKLNPAWHDVLGWTTHDLTSQPYLDFVHPDDRASTIAEASKLASGEITVSFENRYRCRDGSYRWLSWKAVALLEHGLIYATARDVTEQRRAARELDDRMQELAAVNQQLTVARLEAERANRAKSEFLSHMSHDLRTPLNAILGFAQLLEIGNLGPDHAENVRQILSGGRHLLDLINEVLDIARIESGRLSLSLEPVSVQEVVQRAVDLVTPLAVQRGISVEIRTWPSDDAAVMADRQRLTQVLLNLLSNAVKYNRPQGHVTIGWERIPARRFRLTVTDEGAGIPPPQLALLFQPFERLGAEQSAVEGTGLGLALSRALAEAMGGALGVESVVDRGSTFWVELTVAERSAERALPFAPTPTAPERARAQGGYILYIEDNLPNVRLMERILRQRPGIELRHASDGHTGLVMMQERRPDLVLLDLHLPDMSGEEVLRHFWTNPASRRVPIVVLTADATPGLTRRLKAAGATVFLTKPLDVKQVLHVIDDTLADKHQVRADA